MADEKKSSYDVVTSPEAVAALKAAEDKKAGKTDGTTTAKAGGSTGSASTSGGKDDSGFPSPADEGGRRLWYGCVIGDFVLPPDPRSGEVVIECESSAKKDKKGGAGKSKTKTTKQGSNDVKVKIHCKFTTASWADGNYGKGWESILLELDPSNHTGSGGPYAFSHPDASRRGVKNVMVDKIGKLSWKGHLGEVEIDASEWTPEEPKDGDKTETPEKTADGSKWSHKGSFKKPEGASNTNAPKTPSGAPNPANK